MKLYQATATTTILGENTPDFQNKQDKLDFGGKFKDKQLN